MHCKFPCSTFQKVNSKEVCGEITSNNKSRKVEEEKTLKTLSIATGAIKAHYHSASAGTVSSLNIFLFSYSFYYQRYLPHLAVLPQSGSPSS
jgi:hypothetical protein